MAKRFALFLAVLLMAATGFAQLPSFGNVYLGTTMVHQDAGWGTQGNLYGWQLSAEGKVAPFVGMVADLGTSYGTLPIPRSALFGGTGNVDAQSRVVTYMFGPRVSVPLGRFRPFAQVLVGAAHLHQDTSQYAAAYAYGETALADSFGGGVEYRIIPHIAARVTVEDVQTRFHNNYPTKAGTKDNIRTGLGLAFRF